MLVLEPNLIPSKPLRVFHQVEYFEFQHQQIEFFVIAKFFMRVRIVVSWEAHLLNNCVWSFCNEVNSSVVRLSSRTARSLIVPLTFKPFQKTKKLE